MTINIERIPPSFEALQTELRMHPELSKAAQEHGMDFSSTLAFLAAECNIILDGYYSREDIGKIIGDIVEVLKAKRVPLIYSAENIYKSKVMT